DADVLIRDLRAHPHEESVQPGSVMGGLEVASLPGCLVEHQQVDPARNEARPEKEALRVRVLEFSGRLGNTGGNIGIRTSLRPVEPGALACGAVERQCVPPGGTLGDIVEVQNTVGAVCRL